jgi:hypothetical protein
MAKPLETPLAQAERHVAEGEQRLARQRSILEQMERDKHPGAAEQARKVLAVMEQSLRLSQQHLEAERLKESRKQ